VLPPDVNASNYRFEPVDATHIRYGLGGIKGTGQSAVEAIVAARKDAAFRDLFDFCRRVDKRAVNRRAIEALIRAGAFDAIDARRASLIASVGPALEYAEQSERAASQVSLFGEDAGPGAASGPALIVAREWSESERLAHEKASLGYYLSGHPYNVVATELSRLVQQRLGALQPNSQPVRIAGVVTSIRTQASRRGKMAFVTLDDGKEQAEVAVFNETFDAYRNLLREDTLLVAEVKVMQRMNEDGAQQGLRVIAESIYDLAGARRKWARALKLACNGGSSAERLLQLIEPFRSGTCPVTINYRNTTAGGDIQLGDAWRVNLDDHLLGGLREWLQPENVEVVY